MTAFKMKGHTLPGIKQKKSPAKQVKGNMPKGFNITGSSASGKKILTPQEKSAKYKQNFDARQVSKQKGKDFVKNLKTKGDLVSKKPASTTSGTTKTLKNVPKQFATKAKTVLATNLKSAGKQVLKGVAAGARTNIAGALLGAAAGYAYKKGQEVSGGKVNPNQKSIIKEGKKKGSIYGKKTKSIYKKK